MGAAPDAGKLDKDVADNLMNDASVVQLMENPKLVGAIAKLKEEPSCYAELVAADPELGELFGQLKTKLDATETEHAARSKDALPVRKPVDEDAPPLHDATAAEAEQARAEGGACFAREDYAGAAAHYERCTVLTPREPAAWTVRHQSNRTAR